MGMISRYESVFDEKLESTDFKPGGIIALGPGQKLQTFDNPFNAKKSKTECSGCGSISFENENCIYCGGK